MKKKTSNFNKRKKNKSLNNYIKHKCPDCGLILKYDNSWDNVILYCKCGYKDIK